MPCLGPSPAPTFNSIPAPPQVSLTAHLTPEISLSGNSAFFFMRPAAGRAAPSLRPPTFSPRTIEFLRGGCPHARCFPPGGFVPVNGPAGAEQSPRNLNNNFGLKLCWTPSFLERRHGFYYSTLRTKAPWAPWLAYRCRRSLPPISHLSYNRCVPLFRILLNDDWQCRHRFERLPQNPASSSSPNPMVPFEAGRREGKYADLIAVRFSLFNLGSLE